MIGLIMATMLEAKPFVLGLNLQQVAEKPFAVFARPNLRLILSGIGKANAAMATSHLILCHHPTLICNPGAAGATNADYPLGACLHIDHIIEPDRPDLLSGAPSVLTPDTLTGFPLASLATQDRPVRDQDERQTLAPCLVDMEAAAIVQTCQCYGPPCYCFKYVSDLPNHTTLTDICTHITLYREPFFAFFQSQALPALEHQAAILAEGPR